MGPDGQVIHSPAFPPDAIVDTLGAGDTFNASVMFALSKGMYTNQLVSAGSHSWRSGHPTKMPYCFYADDNATV